MSKEADITISGQPLTEAQSMTVRVALGSFMLGLKEDGLGDDATGQAIAEGYKQRLAEIITLIKLTAK